MIYLVDQLVGFATPDENGSFTSTGLSIPSDFGPGEVLVTAERDDFTTDVTSATFTISGGFRGLIRVEHVHTGGFD